MQAVIYLRSAGKRDETVEQQRLACQGLAIQLGATVVAEFADTEDKSDASASPGLSAMLAQLQKTPTELVIVCRGRHLAKRKQYLELILQIGHLGTTVITRDKHIYLFGPSDRTVKPD